MIEMSPVNRSESRNILNIAHRGARSVAPENTLAAARKAVQFGADMWELDVALSADGILFLIHDDTLERTSNVAERFPDRNPWHAHAFTFPEIRQLDFGSWFNARDPFGEIKAGRVSEEDQASYVGEQAPTLEEALLFVREHHWRANVEIKDLSGTTGDASVVDRVVDLIVNMGMVDQVLVSSFNHHYLRRARMANSAISTGALVTEATADPAALLRRSGARAYHPHVTAIQPTDIPSLRQQGIDVLVYTVNDEATMRRLIEHQVSGIFTDFPQRLRSVLKANR